MGASRLSEERVRACSVCEARGAWHHSHFAPRCGFPGGAVRPLFQSKSRRWRASHRASPSHPPGGNHEYRTAETRTQADMGIKARVPEAPTLHALTPLHSPTRSRRPNPCPVGSRGFPASHFEFSQHRLMHPATVGDESTSLAKVLSPVMFCSRAFPCLVRSADFGVGGAMTETSQAGSEDYFIALRFFSGGSSTPVRTSSKSRSTSRP